jgi:hypothetical protein
MSQCDALQLHFLLNCGYTLFFWWCANWVNIQVILPLATEFFVFKTSILPSKHLIVGE